MKVLLIHITGAFGGSSRSLTEAVRAFPGDIEAHFLTPRGTVEGFFGKLGKVLAVSGLSQFDNTQYSYYRGFRWLVILREIANLPATFAAIREAHRRWPDIDLIHLNEFTGLLPMWLAKRRYDVPVVVHVRSVARLDRKALRSRFVNRVLRNNADAVIAIDETVRQSLPEDLPVEVIHNAFTPKPRANPTPPCPRGSRGCVQVHCGSVLSAIFSRSRAYRISSRRPISSSSAAAMWNTSSSVMTPAPPPR